VSEQLVVTADIPFGKSGVYAYRVGDRITPEAVEANGWQDYVQAGDPADVLPAQYDPSAHTAPEVNEYLTTADQTERDRVLGEERTGKARVSVLGETS